MSVVSEQFIQTLSVERFQRYLSWSNGDADEAIQLYTLNCKVSEALYLPLHMLEVALRNRIHGVATTLPVGDMNRLWFDRIEYQLGSRQRDQVASARTDIARNRKQETPGQIVATLTFGFWTSFFGPEYEDLWQRGLQRIARAENGKGLRRKNFSVPLFNLRKLRNRIAHHEPVIHWDLGKHHDEILRLTGYLSPVAAEWSAQHSRFRAVYPVERIALHREE